MKSELQCEGFVKHCYGQMPLYFPLWTRIWFAFNNFFRSGFVFLLGAYFGIFWRHQYFCLFIILWNVISV